MVHWYRRNSIALDVHWFQRFQRDQLKSWFVQKGVAFGEFRINRTIEKVRTQDLEGLGCGKDPGSTMRVGEGESRNISYMIVVAVGQ